MLGVSISPPKGSIAEKPTSSSTTYSTLGAPSGALGCSYGAQSGTESRMSVLMVPLNGVAMEDPSNEVSADLPLRSEHHRAGMRVRHPDRMNRRSLAQSRLRRDDRSRATPRGP